MCNEPWHIKTDLLSKNLFVLIIEFENNKSIETFISIENDLGNYYKFSTYKHVRSYYNVDVGFCL